MKQNRKSILGLAILVFTLVTIFSTLAPTTFADETATNAQVLDMADRVCSFMTSFGDIPNYVYVVPDGATVSAADFFYMMARWLRYYKNNSAAPPTVAIIRNIQGPAAPSGVETGQIQKADILAKAQGNADWIDANNLLPNFSTVGATQYSTKAMYSVFARTLNWYQDNGVLPNYATVSAIDAPSLGWTYGDTISTPTPTPSPTPTANPYPWSKIISGGCNYTEQPDGYTCGPTSLRMAMGYYGTWYSVTTISNYMASIGDSPWYDGVARETIRSAAQHYGFSGAHLSTGLANLKTCIINNWPAICHIQIIGGSYPRYYPSNSPAYSGTYGHYVVCVGLQADANGNVLYFIINDPSRGQYVKYTYSSFMSAWGDKSYYYVNIHS